MSLRSALLGALLLGSACASTPLPEDWQAVSVIERNAEGQSHLALPTSLPSCKHLGMVRLAIPEGVAGVPQDSIDTLKKLAARKGGNTLALLPGKRVAAGTLRGSVFFCQAPQNSLDVLRKIAFPSPGP